jgi:hypothetical protein
MNHAWRSISISLVSAIFLIALVTAQESSTNIFNNEEILFDEHATNKFDMSVLKKLDDSDKIIYEISFKSHYPTGSFVPQTSIELSSNVEPIKELLLRYSVDNNVYIL